MQKLLVLSALIAIVFAEEEFKKAKTYGELIECKHRAEVFYACVEGEEEQKSCTNDLIQVRQCWVENKSCRNFFESYYDKASVSTVRWDNSKLESSKLAEKDRGHYVSCAINCSKDILNRKIQALSEAYLECSSIILQFSALLVVILSFIL